MSHVQVLHDADHAIRQRVPEFSRPRQKALAAALTGTVLAKSAVLSQASRAVFPGRRPTGAKNAACSGWSSTPISPSARPTPRSVGACWRAVGAG